MTIILDKTTTNIQWLRSDVPVLLNDVILSLRLGLQKTPIYFDGNKRSKGSDLVLAAEKKIPKYLSKHSLEFEVLSEQQIRLHFNDVTSQDRLDLFIKININDTNWYVVIEFDSARADQVAKKFVSRVAQVPNNNLVYIAYCYPGTKGMNLNEVNKYFQYMESISKNLNLAGFVGMTPPKNRGDL
ncbi:hypothetical protein [Photobacterium leiognathi]|uniref:hypothetical protein n=1 Tax=Photobacterium leiognathi TaxID=553611 RepID=UPI0029810381|nr:hypothetical protein [Photobacterium leiognathi]